MKKKKDCGCTKCMKVRGEVLETRECFKSELDVIGLFEAHNFQKNKPFKVTFNEGLDVAWGKQHLEEKKLTPRDKKQKEEAVKDFKKKGVVKNLKKKYGDKRGEAVAYALATNKAKKTP
jgi:hypothetical protein